VLKTLLQSELVHIVIKNSNINTNEHVFMHIRFCVFLDELCVFL
jgi:hypothetical protein